MGGFGSDPIFHKAAQKVGGAFEGSLQNNKWETRSHSAKGDARPGFLSHLKYMVPLGNVLRMALSRFNKA